MKMSKLGMGTCSLLEVTPSLMGIRLSQGASASDQQTLLVWYSWKRYMMGVVVPARMLLTRKAFVVTSAELLHHGKMTLLKSTPPPVATVTAIPWFSPSR